MENLETQWKAARQAISISPSKPDELIQLATRRKKTLLYFHFGNIIIFTVTLVILSLFFNSVVLKERISIIGMFLMLSSLSVRLLIEIISTIKSKKIQLLSSTSAATDRALSFYSFRKKVHGTPTITTVVVYIMGFYLLSPEFSQHIGLKWMIMMHVSFLLAALVLITQAKKGMKREMDALKSLIDLKKEMNTD
ncbi:MAG: rane protein [Flaviaesturariibacter sp.]|nr:rane protein [Flaviaesturariibacter sp.]